MLRKVVRERRVDGMEKVGETEGRSCAPGIVLPTRNPPKRKLDFKANASSDQPSDGPPKHGQQLLFFKDDTPVYLNGGDLPCYFPVSFRPPGGIHFIIVELAVGAYIFDNILEKR
ncbi:hypothetical protein PIB30_035606 [Stylosanthes scabra]|uniref:Uncharacterized protein n=1 Tax=Stylosanthes scabra TaxID=79078 RepID=A0ABU6XER2_9FABA|nr:hypothetical protein [Stylosanthes scabra]